MKAAHKTRGAQFMFKKRVERETTRRPRDSRGRPHIKPKRPVFDSISKVRPPAAVPVADPLALQLNLLTYTMKAALALIVALVAAASAISPSDEETRISALERVYANVDIRCLFDEVLCKDLHTVCLDKPKLILTQKIYCDIEMKRCIDGLPDDCKNLNSDSKLTTPKPIR
ncbi:unnamed protein product [Lymnaea stagnalis]|uniref:Uncharacterized protein n=1 Tax=Lymnaea stagnalis TaxID=6523 RepID=A0AAV2HH47_LYMST